MMLSDEDIRVAIKDLINNTTYKIPLSEETKQTLHFSEPFLKKKVWDYDKKFFYVNSRSYSKIAVLILIILSLAMTSVTVYAVYRIFDWRINEGNTDLRTFHNEDFKTSIEQVYRPGGLPVNYDLIETQVNEDSVFSVYCNHENNYIYFSQLLAENENSIDNEDTEQVKVMINGMEAVYFVKHNQSTILFFGHGYVFKLTTEDTFSKAEIIKMAESTIIDSQE